MPLLAVLMAILPALMSPGTAQGPPELTISGPKGLGPGAGGLYTATIHGPFEDNQSVIYRVEAWLEGSDVTGGSPISKSTPFVTSSGRNQLEVNVTAPSKEQEVTLNIKGIVELPGSNFTLTNTFRIQVMRPWTLVVPIFNAAQVAVVNATAAFYLDDQHLGNTTVERIPPKGEANVSFTFVPVGVGPGSHRLRVDLDFNQNGRIDEALGERIITSVVYSEAPPLPPTYIALAVVLGVVLGLAILVWMRRRRG